MNRAVSITARPIQVDDVMAGVADARAGGTAIFVGTVREVDGGRRVTGLDYTAHPSAESLLAGVVDDVVARYPVVSVVAVHRVGELSIGDVAVVTAVGCEHRGDAFEACRTLIDRIKAEVPIWKRQQFADGTEEWVGTP